MNRQHYKAVFFDLDGTLLPMDMDEFLSSYFSRLHAYAAEAGLDAKRFSVALDGGVKAMARDKSDRMNDVVFWENFHQLYGEGAAEADACVNEFYDTAYPHIGDGFQPNPAARHAIEVLSEKGYPLFLTTMPLFPRSGVDWRCRWAGVDPAAFARVTTYDNSFACKPDLRYYQQNMELAGCAPEEVLMVGNNTREDLSICELGADAYLVTDFLIDPVDYPIEQVKHGSLADFVQFAEQLPVCQSASQDDRQGDRQPACHDSKEA